MFVVSTSAFKWEDEKTQLEVRAAAAGGPNPCFIWGGTRFPTVRREPHDDDRATRREKEF